MGAAIAKRLADEGADVALTYVGREAQANQVAEAIRAKGRRALVVQADNADSKAIAAAVEQTVSALGRIDILVNNAGIFLAGHTTEATLADFDQTVAVNVRAVFFASQAAARHMGEGSRIITLGSNVADRVHSPGMALYAMSKSALIGLTKGMARDLGAKGISVSLISPGATDTDMNPAGGEKADFQRGLMAIPRYGSAENIAALVAFVASEAGRSVNGTQFVVDGGTNA
ncbi:SDR family oxidoreductase [Pendulispora albinea]|uniref:SDR family oxidoreductase n=2 Tax=Pendulispora albinea TaxID=2741071 RepID=A0ABZ2M967_9BACT